MLIVNCGGQNQITRVVAALAACVVASPVVIVAQEDNQSIGWANVTEFSLVVTEGNAITQTFGFKNTVRRTWNAARLRARFDGVRSSTADDRFLLLNPGVQFPVGNIPEDFDTTVVTPAVESDVEQYFVEGRFDKDLSEQVFWNVGSSWDRNNNAGILNRYVLFGGIGNTWFAADDLMFSTSYGVSYTDREETELDPNKKDAFGGLRFNSDYRQRFGTLTLFDSDFTLNMSLAEVSDYSINVTNAIGVEMTESLALRVSLQFLYESEPAFEGTSIFARVKLLETDAGLDSANAFFQTVATGGMRLDIGDGKIRKDGRDTILRTALVISF